MVPSGMAVVFRKVMSQEFERFVGLVSELSDVISDLRDQRDWIGVNV